MISFPYLDMTISAISIYRGKFYIKLYDKRNDYHFHVISFPYLDMTISAISIYRVSFTLNYMINVMITIFM